MTKSRECFYCKKCSKILLIFLNLLIFGILVSTFFIIISVASISGFRTVLGDINKSQFSTVKELGVDTQIANLIEKCYDKYSDGDAFSIYNENYVLERP